MGALMLAFFMFALAALGYAYLVVKKHTPSGLLYRAGAYLMALSDGLRIAGLVKAAMYQHHVQTRERLLAKEAEMNDIMMLEKMFRTAE